MPAVPKTKNKKTKKPFSQTVAGKVLKTAFPGSPTVKAGIKFADIVGGYRKPKPVTTPAPVASGATPPVVPAPTPVTTPISKNSSPIQSTTELAKIDANNSSKLDQTLADIERQAQEIKKQIDIKTKEKATQTKTTKTTETKPATENVDVDTEAFDMKASIEGEIRKLEKDSKREIAEAEDILEQQRALIDRAAGGLIDSIKSKFAARVADMEATNQFVFETAERSGFRSGRARYASIMNAGILSSEEAAGIRRIADLQSEELSLISQAESARTKEDFQALQFHLDRVDEIRDEQKKNLLDLYDRIQKADQLALDKAKEERQKLKDDTSLSIDISESIAPAFASKLSTLKTDADKLAFAEKLAKEYGISNPAILLGSLQTSLEGNKKAQADIDNIYSLINSRNKGVDDGLEDDFSGEQDFSGEAGGAGAKEASEILKISKTRAKKLEKAGLISSDIIALQTSLNNGYTLDEILEQSTDVSDKAKGLLKKYVKPVKKKKETNKK